MLIRCTVAVEDFVRQGWKALGMEKKQPHVTRRVSPDTYQNGLFDSHEPSCAPMQATRSVWSLSRACQCLLAESSEPRASRSCRARPSSRDSNSLPCACASRITCARCENVIPDPTLDLQPLSDRVLGKQLLSCSRSSSLVRWRARCIACEPSSGRPSHNP